MPAARLGELLAPYVVSQAPSRPPSTSSPLSPVPGPLGEPGPLRRCESCGSMVRDLYWRTRPRPRRARSGDRANLPALRRRGVGRWSRCGASWYGEAFRGRFTASGELFDPDALTVATRDRGIAFGTLLEVRAGRRSVEVRVNDRMGARDPGDRCLDLSSGAFERLANLDRGVIEVTWRVVGR